MAQTQEPTLFGPAVRKMTLIGAIAGAVAVIAMFSVGVVLTDTDPAVIGAAGLVAPFGGAGFGAMMGAVLGGIKEHQAELEAEARSSRLGSPALED